MTQKLTTISEQLLGTWQRNFFPMWLGQALSLVGSRVVQFALIWYLTQLTGSATVLAMATLVGLVPEIVLGPIAGAYVDRWDRQIVLIVADGLVALASWWLAYLFWTGGADVWQVYLIMFVRAVGGSFHWPAMQASTSLMVPERQLSRINGLNQMLNGGLAIVGPLLGALLLGLLPLFGIMLVDVGTAVLAILPLIFITIPLPKRKDPGSEQASIWSDLRDGLNYLLGWRGLMIVILMALIVRVFLTPAYTLLPLLVSGYFNGTATQLGVLEAVLGVGMLIGGLILGVWGGFRRRIYTSLMGIVVMGLSLLLLGIVPAGLFGLALVSIFLIGLTVPLVDGPIMAVLQAKVAPEIQGRIFTLLSSMVSLATPLGLVIAGPLSDLISIQVWFLVAGIVCVLMGSAMFFVPDVARIEDHQEAAGTEGEPLDAAGAG